MCARRFDYIIPVVRYRYELYPVPWGSLARSFVRSSALFHISLLFGELCFATIICIHACVWLHDASLAMRKEN